MYFRVEAGDTDRCQDWDSKLAEGDLREETEEPAGLEIAIRVIKPAKLSAALTFLFDLIAISKNFKCEFCTKLIV